MALSNSDNIDAEEMEEVTEDTDADTRDVVSEQENDYSDLSNRLTRMEDAINRMSGVVSAMQKAQKSLVDMGAVIRENPADESDEEDSFVPLEKLDFTI